MMHLRDIQIRDPFVVALAGNYYLYGSTDKDIWRSTGVGFDLYTSQGGLEEFEGPFPVFRPPAGFWSVTNFWAPEIHRYQNAWYMFATFKPKEGRRGTAILKSSGGANEASLRGPFIPWSEGPVTPPDWECLDGTFYIDAQGQPFMVFCHEWLQVGDGEIRAMPLSADLKRASGAPELLFRASEAAWAKPLPNRAPGSYVTDGPNLFTGQDGTLFMLWSSFGEDERYRIGTARSENGLIRGPWAQDSEPLYAADGGHGMIFRSHEGKLLLAIHSPNRTPLERARFIEIEERGGWLRQK
jgi:GH43 family beta-xylosidase